MLRVQSVSAVLQPVRVAKAIGDALWGDAPTNLTVDDTALDHSLAFECTQHGYQLVLCHLCHTALLVNLAVWSDQLAPVLQALNPVLLRRSSAGTQLAGPPAIFQMIYCHWLPSSLVRMSIAIGAGASPTNTDSMLGD